MPRKLTPRLAFAKCVAFDMLPASTGPARGVLGIDASWRNRPREERAAILSGADCAISMLESLGWTLTPLPPRVKRKGGRK